ncbi:MAG TPA: polysaccharide biosynthesis/export family protein [Thermoanaerobaculia bacterium]|jgi:polysaccharide export outer membrane protein|nr:polysaccharide biosynthesis/export family protein [Thermoanaerobaculia bacterium]
MKKIAVPFSILLLVCVAITWAQATDPAYRIGPRDLLRIRVDEDEKLNGDRRVTEAGAVNFPLLGDVSVEGKTPGEIALTVKKLLEDKYMQRASVDVQVVEFRSRPISIIGAVKQPGNLGFSGHWTLLEALTAAGGLTENHGNVAYILRRADNGLSDQVTIDLDDLLVRGEQRINVPIFANDLINVPVTVEVTVYCLGEVTKPGALAFKSSERITLLAAIAHAGGLTNRASNKILIKRGLRADGPQEINVDFKRILAGKEPDIDLWQGDVIVVKESFF